MIVVDASVALKWIQEGEKDREKARQLRIDHLIKKNELLVPHLIFYEVANALATKSETNEEYIKKGIDVLYKTSLSVYKEQKEDILRASILAKRHKTTVYDMLYAIIAKNKDLDLITADENFAKKTCFGFVKLLSAIKSS